MFCCAQKKYINFLHNMSFSLLTIRHGCQILRNLLTLDRFKIFKIIFVCTMTSIFCRFINTYSMEKSYGEDLWPPLFSLAHAHNMDGPFFSSSTSSCYNSFAIRIGFRSSAILRLTLNRCIRTLSDIIAKNANTYRLEDHLWIIKVMQRMLVRLTQKTWHNRQFGHYV